MTPEPTMAFAMPPPVSPTGSGIWVKKAQFSELAPFQQVEQDRDQRQR